MLEFTTSFILSQVFMFLAMLFDFVSFQFKERKKLFLCLIISSAFISTHYFLLNKTVAGTIMIITVLRFIIVYYTTDKRLMYLFLLFNTLVLIFTYTEIFDIIIYVSQSIMVIGNFQSKDKTMRKTMMLATVLAIAYNFIILSPMGVIITTSFLISNIIGYYRHYVKNAKTNHIKSNKD